MWPYQVFTNVLIRTGYMNGDISVCIILTFYSLVKYIFMSKVEWRSNCSSLVRICFIIMGFDPNGQTPSTYTYCEFIICYFVICVYKSPNQWRHLLAQMCKVLQCIYFWVGSSPICVEVPQVCTLLWINLQ